MAVVGNRFRNNNERGCKTAVQARKRKFRLPPSLARVDYVHLGLGLSFLKRWHGIVHDLLDLFRESGPAENRRRSHGHGVDRIAFASSETAPYARCAIRNSPLAKAENTAGKRWLAPLITGGD